MAEPSRTGRDARRAADVVKRAKARAGDGWPLLGTQLQRALICAAIVDEMNMFDEETSDAAIRRNLFSLIEKCGVDRG